MIAVYAPGSVSNVACGFDVMGFALDEPGDIVVVEPQEAAGVSIAAIHGDDGRLTHDPRNIIAGKRDQMMGKVQEAYGLCKQKAAGN